MTSTEAQEQTATDSTIMPLAELLWSNDFTIGNKASAIEDTMIHVVDGAIHLEPQQVTALVALLAHYDNERSIKAQYDSNPNP